MNKKIDEMIKEADSYISCLRDMLDIKITEEFGLDPSIIKELSSLSNEKIDSITSEMAAQFYIEKSLDDSVLNRTNVAHDYVMALHEKYNDDSEWSNKEFVEYIKYAFKTIKSGIDEVKGFEAERDKIIESARESSKNWFDYVNSDEYKKNKQKKLDDIKAKLDNEEDPNRKRKLIRAINQIETSESLSFLFSRLEENPEKESLSIKETYFNPQQSKVVMSKFKKKVQRLGYKPDIYKRFFNLEEMFLPEEYADLNNIFLFHVMRFIGHTDANNERDVLYVSSVLSKIYNLIYHKYDDQVYEEEFIDIIKKIDDYFMPYIDEFKEKNITSPNNPIRKQRDKEYDERLRLMLITHLQNEGIDVDTTLSTDELRSMLNDIIEKKSENNNENGENDDAEISDVTDDQNVIDNKVIDTEVIYRDRFNYYYKENKNDENFTYYDTDGNVYEENVPQDDVLRLVTGGNLTKETIPSV